LRRALHLCVALTSRAIRYVSAQEHGGQEALHRVDPRRAFEMRIDLWRLLEHTHRFGVRRDAKRREVPRMELDISGGPMIAHSALCDMS